MADWYCDNTNGNDSTGSGTSGSPYQTIQKCVDSATRGDNIYVANTSAQVLSSALSWSTGFTNTGTNPTTIIGWDNGGSLIVNVPGSGDITAGKIDASGLSVDWSGTSMPSGLHFVNLILDSSTSTNSFSGGWSSNFTRCHFQASLKSSGYHVANAWMLTGCVFESFGASAPDTAVGCFFNNQSGTTLASVRTSIANFITLDASYTGSANIVTTVDGAKFIGNTIIAKGSTTGALFRPNNNCLIIDNVFQGASGTGGVAMNLRSLIQYVAKNIFYDNTTNVSNDSLAEYVSSNVTAGSVPYTDAGTNQWLASSELESSAYVAGYIGTSTQTYKDAGAIEYLSTGGAAGSSRLINGGLVR